MKKALACVLLLAAPVAGADEAPVNAASYVGGCRQVREDGLVLATGARNDPGWLLDGRADTNWEVGTAAAGRGVILRFAEPYDLSRLEFVAATDRAESVREILVEGGPAPGGPWQRLVQTTLKQDRAPQSLGVDAKGVRCLRLTFLSNYGHPGWWGLADFRALGRRSTERAVAWNGVWGVRLGSMRLIQRGARITGCVNRGAAVRFTVDGSSDGASFFGTWTEQQGATTRSGGLAMVIDVEGRMVGQWSDSHDLKKLGIGRWDGEAVAHSTFTCPSSEAGLAGDLAQNGRVVLRGILFDTDKDVIRSESIPVLEELAKAMRASGATRYVIEGHTDDRAGEKHNQVLSERRAASVKRWLVGAGVAAPRLDTIGYGLSRPALPNDTAAGRAANRRVEVARK